MLRKIPEKPEYSPDKVVLTKAVKRLAERLNLNQQELSAILGPSKSTFSRIFNGPSYIDPLTKEGQLAILLVRIYRNLDALFGGNMQQSQQWLRTRNKFLENTPILCMRSPEGLIAVVHLLDVMRER